MRIARLACSAACALVLLAAGDAGAQSAMSGVPNAMQGFSQNRDQPIQIEAASLEMRDKKKEATFAGNVKVVQGDTTMTSKTLVVFYDSASTPAATAANAGADAKGERKSAPMQSATPGPGGSSSIRRLEAKGNVVVTQKDQVVTGETAIFDTKANLITMVGGVVLTQGKNVLRGDRLMVDMTTGVSRVESDSGRVQGLFIPPAAAERLQSRNAGRLRRRRCPSVPQINQNNINHLYRYVPVARLKPAGQACIYRAAGGASGPGSRVFRRARDIRSFMLRRPIDGPAAGRGTPGKA